MILRILLSGVVAAFVMQPVAAQPLAGMDELGRVLPQYEETGGPKADRHVGLFYFLWQGDKASPTSEKHWDLTELYAKTPEVFKDFDHPGWGGGAGLPGKYYFWGESIYGYYRGDDYWVHLKNMQLLTDAGVDFLVLDATNRLTYPQQSDALMRAMDAIRKQGKQPPKLVFYTNTASGEAMQEIYNNYYKAGAPHRYPDCWFYLEGKPLIIGLSPEAAGRDYAAFFTIRESQWPNEPQKVNGWPWIEFQRPQKVYSNRQGEREIVNVSTAQHPNLDASMGGSAFHGQAGNWGRSYRQGSPGDPAKDLWYGYNVQEQWDFALQQNVPFIFITGWNEWIAGKWRRSTGDKNQALFVDQANAEYSRDIEPSLTDGLKDHYYMQMVSNIRYYKGTDTVPASGIRAPIGNWADWDQVVPAYTDYVGDVLHRHHPGAQSDPVVTYVNETGRNDFETLKVAASDEVLYFYAKTANTITPVLGDNWMTLWLNVDQSYQSGWLGYDFRIVSGNDLQRYVNGSWQHIGAVSHQVSGNQLMITVPFAALGLPASDVTLELKWSDNMQKADPLDWYVNGDAAPGGRFNVLVRF
ncbi:hypothetical protein [Parapedobacter sp. DT-150]|uniref:hypothetical protein n=1 Tax=Parapedobacter sp. DT-150 TaxID=3396162 RepID=UPI003F1A92C3